MIFNNSGEKIIRCQADCWLGVDWDYNWNLLRIVYSWHYLKRMTLERISVYRY
jgi:hypothetical protein